MTRKEVLADAKKNLIPTEFCIFKHLLDYVIAHKTHTTYEPVGDAVGIPHNHDCMSGFLANISEYTKGRYGFFFSVLVYSAANTKPPTGPGPGIGFVNLVWDHGISISSPAWYEHEKQKVIQWATALQ